MTIWEALLSDLITEQRHGSKKKREIGNCQMSPTDLAVGYYSSRGWSLRMILGLPLESIHCGFSSVSPMVGQINPNLVESNMWDVLP